MGIFKKITQRKQEKIKQLVIKNGLILFALNLLLAIALFLLTFSFNLFLSILDLSDAVKIFIPLAIIFIFAGFSAILWFRIGQHLNTVFTKKRIAWVCLSVLIAVVLSIAFLLILTYSFLFFGNGYLVGQVVFSGVLFVTFLSIVFELPIISLGLISRK